MKKIQDLIEKAKAMDEKELEAWRYSLFFLVVANLFGVYWFLGLHKLGAAILIVQIIALSIILILEKRLPPKPNKKPENPKGGNKKMKKKEVETDDDEEQEEETEEEKSSIFDLGLPDADEYQKRAEKALGSW